jgi:hypothetical protein
MTLFFSNFFHEKKQYRIHIAAELSLNCHDFVSIKSLNTTICNVYVMPRENVVENRILNILSKELLSTSQVAKELNMRREVASGFLEALRQQGKLQLVRVGRSNVYRTISNKKMEVAS